MSPRRTTLLSITVVLNEISIAKHPSPEPVLPLSWEFPFLRKICLSLGERKEIKLSRKNQRNSLTSTALI